MRAFLILVLFFTTPAGLADEAALFDLIDARLELMKDVGVYKWQHDIDIEDVEREAVVLEEAVTAAVQKGIEVDTARAFFAAQIEAAKDIQRYWFRAFETAPPANAGLDLMTEVRPQLLQLGDRIALELARTGSVAVIWEDHFNQAVDVAGLSPASRAALFQTLTAVQHYPSRLDQILATGALRVGTTGDYAPFSHRKDDGELHGIDIELARDLASELGVDVDFVETSWPTLMADLESGQYDVAMSGVSRILARQVVGYFSQPYHVGGKTPIARCEDAARLDTLEKIDQPGVRLIVNPGGTNQRLVDEFIEHADVRIFEDNRTIFNEIAEGRADVMITDAIEVRLKAAADARLCATMPGRTLTRQEKAYLMPRDVPLKEFVDTWLEQRIKDGTVEAIMARHLP